MTQSIAAQKTQPLSLPQSLWRWLPRQFLPLLFVLSLLLLGDVLCYQQGLPLEIDEQGGNALLRVGSQSLALGTIGTPVTLQFPPHDPVIHEYQIDGTDSTNNFTLDTSYLHALSTHPYYLFQAWMRDLNGTSRWSDLHVYNNDQLLIRQDWPNNGSSVGLQSPSSGTISAHPSLALRIQLMLRRPETPMTLNLITQNNTTIEIGIDRNDRKIAVTRLMGGQSEEIASTFFPVDVIPFAAMVLDTALRTTIWAILLLLFVQVSEILLAAFFPFNIDKRRFQAVSLPSTRNSSQAPPALRDKIRLQGAALFLNAWRTVTQAIHPLALALLFASFCFVLWIALVQYHAEPHIYDANAYLFAAKMYATGHLSVPIPPAINHFPGPFMVQHNGQWFAQYAPGTALTLVPGIWLGAPWLIEPLLGTLALLGIGLIAAGLYDRRVATLTVILGALSPFYSYLAASYLSHAFALFYLVWGLWLLLRFAQGGAGWHLPLAACFFGMASLTRDLVTVLFVAIMVLGVLALSWRQLKQDWVRWIIPGIFSLSVAFVFVSITLDFNLSLTGNPQVSPRSLFFAGDHWGFGQGVGFYGQHTVAAGLVNLDELLTILAIDLYGWPFYFTLAFLVIPFLTRRAKGADWFLLLSFMLIAGAYIGYFYHGIYLGPRYLFETLPFLLILTARGMLTLAETGIATAQTFYRHWRQRNIGENTRGIFSIPTIVGVTALLLCNLLYFMPRQVELHKDYTGLPNGYHIDLQAIYHPPLHNAIIVTDDYTIYQFVLFPLNDPFLRDNVIYAWSDTMNDIADLHAAFPDRQLYRLDIAADGSVQYTQLSSP